MARINEELAGLGYTFCPWELSRIPAFSLPYSLKIEDETRLLIKKHIEGEDRTIPFGDGKVWPVPLAAPNEITNDPWCEIELVEIKAGPDCDTAGVRSIISETDYKNVPALNH